MSLADVYYSINLFSNTKAAQYVRNH